MNLGSGLTQCQHILGRQPHGALRNEITPVGASQHLAFGFGIRIAQRKTQQKTIELRIGQRIGAGQVQWILSGDHEERLGQGVTDAVDGDLLLGHRLEQRALGARRRAVDLVGQQQLGKNWARMKSESTVALLVDRYAQDVRWQQVGSELKALEIQPQRGGERARQRGLAEAGQILDQQMSAGQQAGERHIHLSRLAQHQSIHLCDGIGQRLTMMIG